MKENDGSASRNKRKKCLLLFSSLIISLVVIYYFQSGIGEGRKSPQGLRAQSQTTSIPDNDDNDGNDVKDGDDDNVDDDDDGDNKANGNYSGNNENRDELSKGKEKDIGRMILFEVENLDGSTRNGITGHFTVQTRPDWAPIGVERFETLTRESFWDGCRFFRVIENFVVQFGINGNPSVQKKWRGKTLKDDKVKASNQRGIVTFGTSGKDTRATQLFINTGENKFLDSQDFSPIGKVVAGMDVVDKIYNGYGDKKDSPKQNKIQTIGNKYLEQEFPKLSYIKKATFIT